MHPDLKELAINVTEWPDGTYWGAWLPHRKGQEEKEEFFGWPESMPPKYHTAYTRDQWQAARQQLGLDQPEVTPEEDEAWKVKEREMSIDEARAILSNDNVNHPQHYQSDNGIECIDAIRAALGLDGFVAHCRGTAIKYAFRAGKKQAHAEDLRKAGWYLNKAAEALDE